jgi:hypothetical protein
MSEKEISIMNLPQFSAEASLTPPSAVYRNNAIFGGATAASVSPAQFGIVGFPMRCCGYSTLLHRFFCVTRNVRPWENCRCEHGYFGDPVILCKPLVATAEVGQFSAG